MIYLATPYSHPDPRIRRYRFESVTRVAGELMNQGHHVYSPITHSHPIAVAVGLPAGWDYWEPFDRVMLAACSEMRVLQLCGWDVSVGVAAEISLAEEMGIDVSFTHPSDWESLIHHGHETTPGTGPETAQDGR